MLIDRTQDPCGSKGVYVGFGFGFGSNCLLGTDKVVQIYYLIEVSGAAACKVAGRVE